MKGFPVRHQIQVGRVFVLRGRRHVAVAAAVSGDQVTMIDPTGRRFAVPLFMMGGAVRAGSYKPTDVLLDARVLEAEHPFIAAVEGKYSAPRPGPKEAQADLEAMLVQALRARLTAEPEPVSEPVVLDKQQAAGRRDAMSSKTLSRYEAAELAGMRVQGIDYHRQAKSFRWSRRGREIRIHRESFDGWLAARARHDDAEQQAPGAS